MVSVKLLDIEITQIISAISPTMVSTQNTEELKAIFNHMGEELLSITE